MKYSPDVVERFWSFVGKGEDCWLWEGTTELNPYGGMLVNGKRLRAHRISWEIHHGEIPEGMMVCHKCDIPNCVNPKHLFLGTNRMNVDDCLAKGRATHQKYPDFAARGENHGSAKLSEKQVFQLRRLSVKGVSGYRMSKWLGMGTRTIRKLLDGVTWKHVPFPIHEKDTLELHTY